MKANNSEKDILRMPILNFNTGDLPPDSESMTVRGAALWVRQDQDERADKDKWMMSRYFACHLGSCPGAQRRGHGGTVQAGSSRCQ